MTTPGDRHSVAGAMFFLAFVSALIPMMATDAVGVNMDVVPIGPARGGMGLQRIQFEHRRGVLLRYPFDAGARP